MGKPSCTKQAPVITESSQVKKMLVVALRGGGLGGSQCARKWFVGGQWVGHEQLLPQGFSFSFPNNSAKKNLSYNYILAVCQTLIYRIPNPITW